jgi:hypothetical protein
MSTLKVDTITDAAGSGAPDFPNGMTGNGSSLTGLATEAQGALAATALQPNGDGSGLTGVGGSTDVGAVGTYYVGRLVITTTGGSGGYDGGTTVAGSLIQDYSRSIVSTNDTAYPLKASDNDDYVVSAGLSGTWRIMSGDLKWRETGEALGTLFVRIS